MSIDCAPGQSKRAAGRGRPSKCVTLWKVLSPRILYLPSWALEWMSSMIQGAHIWLLPITIAAYPPQGFTAEGAKIAELELFLSFSACSALSAIR